MAYPCPMAALDSFHPVVRSWFTRTFEGPTTAQERGWAEILAGRDTLIAAPTGSGKTLAAFLAASTGSCGAPRPATPGKASTSSTSRRSRR